MCSLQGFCSRRGTAEVCRSFFFSGKYFHFPSAARRDEAARRAIERKYAQPGNGAPGRCGQQDFVFPIGNTIGQRWPITHSLKKTGSSLPAGETYGIRRRSPADFFPTTGGGAVSSRTLTLRHRQDPQAKGLEIALFRIYYTRPRPRAQAVAFHKINRWNSAHFTTAAPRSLAPFPKWKGPFHPFASTVSNFLLRLHQRRPLDCAAGSSGGPADWLE